MDEALARFERSSAYGKKPHATPFQTWDGS
jgi:hypothetical protein